MNGSRPSYQGLIATHNPELFQELFDSPSDDMGDSGNASVHKLYADGVEGDHFTEEDEDKYKFISDQIEDFDEKQYSMLLDSSRKENNSRGRSQTGQPQNNSRGRSDAPLSRGGQSQPHNTQFVVKNRQNMTDEERDLEDLRREERYQEKLRQKLQEYDERENVFIPKLELEDSDDEEKVKKNRSEPLDINLRDSLEDEPERVQPQTNETRTTSQREIEHRDSLEEQQPFVRDSLEWTGAHSSNQERDQYQPQPGVHGNDPLSRMFYPNNEQTAGQHWDNQGPSEPHMSGFGGDPVGPEEGVPQGSGGNVYPVEDSSQGYDQSYGQYSNGGVSQDQPDPGQAEAYDNIRRKYDHKVASEKDWGVQRVRKPVPVKPKHDIDYVERNKAVAKKKEGKSYSALHAKKKEPETPVKPSSAEQLWQGDAQSYRTPHARGPYNAPLRKYPSESRVDEMKLQGARAAPHRVGPMAHRPAPVEAFAEPRRLAHPNQHSQHPVYADSGQQFDVDVSVKRMSPHAPERQPLESQYPAQESYDPQGPYPQRRISQDDYYGYAYQHRPSYSDAHGYNYAHQGNQSHHGDGYHGHEQAPQHYNYRQPYHPFPQEEWAQQPSIGGSYRGSITTTEGSQTRVGSPYKVLPPINIEDIQNDNHLRAKASPRRDVSPGREEGSYMEAFRSKKNKKVDYKKYTLNDYRKLNLEVHRGGLGPETNGYEYRNRREKVQRQQEYARIIAEKNRKDMEVAKARPEAMPRRPDEGDYDDAFQRRMLAKEYARSVPKPKPRSKPPSGVPSSDGSTYRSSTSEAAREDDRHVPSSGVSRHSKTPVIETIDLEALQRRHEEEKRQADTIRQNVAGVH